MTLQVFTAQLSRSEVDGLDITRADGLGASIAPSEQLQRLRPANEEVRVARRGYILSRTKNERGALT